MAGGERPMEVQGAGQMRVYDLREWHRVVAKCWRCGHQAEITYRGLRQKRLGPTHLTGEESDAKPPKNQHQN